MVVLRDGMCPGLDRDLVRDLRAKDVRTVEDLVSCDLEELAQRCSLSYKTLFAVRRVLLAQNASFPVSGADLYEETLSSTAILSTGNPSLDRLLDSGVYTGEITELAGAPGSGKTQVCLGVSAHVSLQLKQGVVFIDSTGGLTAGRLLHFLQGLTPNREEQMEALQRIRVFRSFDVVSLLDVLHALIDGGLQQGPVGVSVGSVKVVIVDSVSAVISPLLGGKHSEGMSLMMQVSGVLKSMAKDFNVAALVTNHITAGPGPGPGGVEVQPGLGLTWSHVPRTRILLERKSTSSSSLRTATIIKSSRQACHIKQELDLQSWSRTEDEASGKRKLQDL